MLDREHIDRTNRNRYVLALASDEGSQKATFLATYLERLGLRAHAVPMHWLEALTRLDPHPIEALATMESALRYRLVLSCVDTNHARGDIQRSWPLDIIGASTLGLRASAIHYDLRTPTACLACFNEPRAQANAIEGLRREIESAAPSERPGILIRNGIEAHEVEAVLQHLARPKCGELGESALSRFAENGPPAFSVGFVSVAAGLLLARHWIAFSQAGPAATTPAETHGLFANFFNGRLSWVEQQARAECACAKDRLEIWEPIWAFDR